MCENYSRAETVWGNTVIKKLTKDSNIPGFKVIFYVKIRGSMDFLLLKRTSGIAHLLER